MPKNTAPKITVKQRKAAEKIVAALKRDEAHISRRELGDRCEAIYMGNDYATLGPIYREVERMVGEWMDGARADYQKLAADVEVIEQAERATHPDNVYLFDESVDHENVTERGSSEPAFTEESIGYWSRMLGAAGPTIGDRANAYGIDINARLGRAIY